MMVFESKAPARLKIASVFLFSKKVYFLLEISFRFCEK
jgi:hypothetical protein